jgi:hypothetical protein
MSDTVLGSVLAATVTALLVGCSRSGATPVNGPDGQPGWFNVWCKVDQGNCDKKSNEVCPDGYELVDISENAGTPFANYKSAYVFPSYRGYMLIKCHGAAAAVADGGDDGG